jgi:hypothetical protein
VPQHQNLFKEWAMRVPVVGMAPDVSSTSCSGRFALPDSIASQLFLFNFEKFDPPSTDAAPPIPKQTSDYHPTSVWDILTPEALKEV